LPELTPTLEGLVGDDAPADAGTFTCELVRPVVPGDQPIVCSGTATDLYEPSFVDGTLTVLAAPRDPDPTPETGDEEVSGGRDSRHDRADDRLPDTGAPAVADLLALGLALSVAGLGV